MVARTRLPLMTKLSSDALNFLWVIDFEYEARLHHGAFIRYFNLATELIAQGHTDIFAVNFLDLDREPSIQYFQQLKAKGVFTDFIEANFEAPLWRIHLAARLVYPGLANHVLRSAHRTCAARIDAIAREHGS